MNEQYLIEFQVGDSSTGNNQDYAEYQFRTSANPFYEGVLQRLVFAAVNNKALYELVDWDNLTITKIQDIEEIN